LADHHALAEAALSVAQVVAEQRAAEAGWWLALAASSRRACVGTARCAHTCPCGCGLLGAHHLAAVLEQLHVADLGARSPAPAVCLRPQVDHARTAGLA
jgi:hypothetical protein